jgi:hypothetical protein
LEWQLGGHGSPERERALGYLRHWHYLGCNRPVGTHLVSDLTNAVISVPEEAQFYFL